MFLQKRPSRLTTIIIAVFLVPLLVYLVADLIKYQVKLTKIMELVKVENFTFWMNELRLRQDDPELVTFVKDHLLIPPNADSSKRTASEAYPMMKMRILEPYLRSVTNGFYVDIGSHGHGQDLKASVLWLEQTLSWTGLRIEPDPVTFSKLDLMGEDQRAWFINSRLSRNKFPEIRQYDENSTSQVVEGLMVGQSIPLYTILLAIGRMDVGYMNLRTDGSELAILETIPFDKVKIQTLSVTYFPSVVGKAPLKLFMERKGYKIIKEVRRELIFVPRVLLKRISTNSTTHEVRPSLKK